MASLRTRIHVPVVTAALVALMALVAFAAPASAVRYGTPDNSEHPYVGLLVFYDEAGTAQWRCTGTLVSPTLVVTAAHCAELNAGARFYLDEKVNTTTQPDYPYEGGYTGTAYAGPEWQGGLFIPNTGDIGVVVLDRRIRTGATLPKLAPAGYLDKLAKARGQQSVDFEVVGYGLQAVKPVELALRERMKATVQLTNLKSALNDGYNLQTSNAPGSGTGGGGTCFGDSGGAIFHVSGGTHYIVAVNSFVMNENCAGSSFGYRTDRQPVIDWIMGDHD